MLLKRVFGFSSLGTKLRTRTDGNLFKVARKTKGENFNVRDLLFAYDVAHYDQYIQTPLNQFSPACSDFGLTISLKKT